MTCRLWFLPQSSGLLTEVKSDVDWYKSDAVKTFLFNVGWLNVHRYHFKFSAAALKHDETFKKNLILLFLKHPYKYCKRQGL